MGNNISAELLDKYETELGAVESIGYEISRGYTHSLLVALVKDMQNGKATATDGERYISDNAGFFSAFDSFCCWVRKIQVPPSLLRESRKAVV